MNQISDFIAYAIRRTVQECWRGMLYKVLNRGVEKYMLELTTKVSFDALSEPLNLNR